MKLKQILIGGAVAVLLALGIKSARAVEFEGVYGLLGAGYYLDVGNHLRVEDDRGLSADLKTSPSAIFGFYGVWDFGKKRRVQAGVIHNSNWFTGPPFNSKGEIDKTEIQLRYEYCIAWCK